MNISNQGQVTQPRMAFSIPEAARVIGISQSKFWNMIREKEVKATKLGGRTLITVRELSRLLGVSGSPSPEGGLK
ncbi:MAG: helix-turn-helix domain-containing protein [Rhabdaerophilum sp.]